MLLHADAVAQNRPASVRAGRIHRDDADRVILLAIVAGKLIDKRALACTRWAGQSKDPGLSAVGKQRLEQF